MKGKSRFKEKRYWRSEVIPVPEGEDIPLKVGGDWQNWKTIGIINVHKIKGEK